jgi:hypothetical protein
MTNLDAGNVVRKNVSFQVGSLDVDGVSYLLVLQHFNRQLLCHALEL